jgi:hypothetical protein
MEKQKIWKQERPDGTYNFFAEGGKWDIGQTFDHASNTFQITTRPFGGRVTMGGKWTYVFQFEAKKIQPPNGLL